MNEGIKHIFTSLRINLGLIGKNQRLSESIDYLEVFIEMQSDELETLHSAHADLNRQHSNTKTMLNNTRNNLKLADEELIRLTWENNTYKKRNDKLTRKSNQMGKDLLWAKNKLRENGVEQWKLLNKEERNNG